MPTVRVPQKEGEVRLNIAGDKPVIYPVTNHEVTVKDTDLDHFLIHVDGSSVVTKSKTKE